MKAPRFRVTPASLQNAFDKLSDYLERLPKEKKIIAGSHIRKEEDDVSVTLHGTPAGTSSSSFSCICPFDVELTPVENDDSQKVSLRAGFINGIVPEGLREFDSLEPEDSGYVYLEINVGADSGVRSAVPKFKQDAPPNEDWPIGENTVQGLYNVVVAYIGEGFDVQRLLHCGSFSLQPKPVCTNGGGGKYKILYTMTIIPT